MVHACGRVVLRRGAVDARAVALAAPQYRASAACEWVPNATLPQRGRLKPLARKISPVAENFVYFCGVTVVAHGTVPRHVAQHTLGSMAIRHDSGRCNCAPRLVGARESVRARERRARVRTHACVGAPPTYMLLRAPQLAVGHGMVEAYHMHLKLAPTALVILHEAAHATQLGHGREWRSHEPLARLRRRLRERRVLPLRTAVLMALGSAKNTDRRWIAQGRESGLLQRLVPPGRAQRRRAVAVSRCG